MADHEDPQAPAPEEAPAETGGPKKIVLIGTLAGTIVAGAAIGLLVIGPMIAGPPDAAAADSTEHAEAADSEHSAGTEGQAERLHVIDNMVLNPAQSNGARFLLVATAIEVSEPALVETLKARDAEARDVLIGVLGSRTVEQLSSLAMRDTLRAEIAQAFNAMLKKPKGIRRVYFPQFVIQ